MAHVAIQRVGQGNRPRLLGTALGDLLGSLLGRS